MRCDEIQKQMIDIVEKNLSHNAEQEVKKHLESCNRCQESVRYFSLLWQVWNETEPQQTSPDFRMKLSKKIQHNEDISVNRIFNPKWLLQTKPLLTTATIIIAVILGIHLGSPVYDNEAVSGGNTLNVREVLDEHYLGPFADFPKGSVGEFMVRMENTVTGGTE